MFKCFERALLIGAAMLFAGSATALDDFSGVGRPATSDEIKAWNIDVRPDFKGLPKGSGSVEQGEAIWDNKCATCHGTFAESNKVFTPLVGGTSKEDMASGHVAALMRRDFPARTTFMKVATVSTLYDYIHRAMPWNAPKSLSDDDVYAVLAYLLNLADIVPDDFVLNETTIRDVQKIMPNRNGMTFDHALWPGIEFGGPAKPDTDNQACMKNCKTEVKIASILPDYAWASHGDLEKQNRTFGPVRGMKTANESADSDAPASPSPYQLAESAGCLGCHGLNAKIVGPGYNEVAAKYHGQDVLTTLVTKVKNGGEGVWGSTPMPPQSALKDEEIKMLVSWILAGAKEK